MIWAVSLSTKGPLRPLSHCLFNFKKFVVFKKLINKISLILKEPYLYKTKKTLYLNKFRKELAISEFVWPFTPNYKSSSYIATYVSSVLHFLLQKIQLVHN